MYHFIGIKGTGMGPLAQIMHELGYEVQGSDKEEHYFTEVPLREKKIPIFNFDANHIQEGMMIVQGNAFNDSNVEVKRAKELDLTIYSYQEMLGKLTKMFDTITVAGCHGKTSTSAMLAHVLDPLVGANYLIGDGTGHAKRENRYFILEACEWKRHFLEYSPYYAIITNLELDHMDYFKDMEDIKDAFTEYANHASKMVIAYGDDSNICDLKIEKPVIYYGESEDNHVVCKNVDYHNDGTDFDVEVDGAYYGHFSLPLFGKHMLLNCLAVISVCYYEGLEANQVSQQLKTFPGAKRRFKETFLGDIVTIDDYAHHPTEVKVTIQAARQKYPDKQIIAILKTHTLSRTKLFAKEFADALNLADKAYIMDVGVDRPEVGYDGVTYQLILDQLKNGAYMSLELVDQLLQYKNAVLLFMSSKDIYVLKELYEKKLKEQRGKSE